MKAGVWPLEDNPLVNAPHIQSELVAEWAHPYSQKLQYSRQVWQTNTGRP